MSSMIKSLTKSQKALLPVYVETWKNIALGAKIVDRPKAESLLNEAYVKAGLIPPKRIIWFSSRKELLLYAACIERNTKHPAFDSVYYSVWDSVWASVRDSVSDSVSYSVSDSVSTSVWDPAWDSVRASVSASAYASVNASVWDSAYWYSDLAFYDYFRTVCELKEETEKISGFIDFAQHCGSFYAMKNFALLCDDSHKEEMQNG